MKFLCQFLLNVELQLLLDNFLFCKSLYSLYRVCHLPHNPVFINCKKVKLHRRKFKAFQRLRRSIEISRKPAENQEKLFQQSADEVSENVYVKHRERGVYLVATQKLRVKHSKQLEIQIFVSINDKMSKS